VPCLPCPTQRTLALAAVPTRLSDIDDTTQERLINRGYAVCDAALRAHLDPQLPAATAFPYRPRRSEGGWIAGAAAIPS